MLQQLAGDILFTILICLLVNFLFTVPDTLKKIYNLLADLTIEVEEEKK